jgi:hypothetical protein
MDEISREAAPIRKVIQISAIVHPEKGWAFVTLCDDGSLRLYHWLMAGGIEGIAYRLTEKAAA